MDALWAALVSIDRTCGQLVDAVQGREPQLYGTILLAVLVAAYVFPPRNDSDQI